MWEPRSRNGTDLGTMNLSSFRLDGESVEVQFRRNFSIQGRFFHLLSVLNFFLMHDPRFFAGCFFFDDLPAPLPWLRNLYELPETLAHLEPSGQVQAGAKIRCEILHHTENITCEPYIESEHIIETKNMNT